MPVYDIHSRRQKRAEGAEPEVYEYDNFPENVRVQIGYILEEAIGHYWARRGVRYGTSTPAHNNEACLSG